MDASGGGVAGEGDALVLGFCVGEAFSKRSSRTLRCDGKLLSPERRRWAVEVLRARFRVSERLACRVVGQHRSTHRHGGKVIELEEVKLRHRLRQIAADHIRWGRRMTYRLLRRKGWTVNQKRVQRFWWEEGLQRAHSQDTEAGTARRRLGEA